MTPDDEPVGKFSISLDVVGPTAVVSLRGHLGSGELTDLGAALNTVIANGYSSMVMDLEGLDSLVPPAMTLIAGTARRLADGGRELSIRSPSTPIHRLLVARGLGHLVRDQKFGVLSERPGKHPAVVARVPDVLPAEERVAPSVVSALPTEGDLVDATLRLVVELARATVGGADGVSVSLRRHGRLATVAASDQTVLDMDAHQYATGEGPCVDASVKGRWFHAQSLDAEERWPDFTPKARALGIRAILSSPLVAWDRPVGALNIYSRRSSAFASEDQMLAMKFATEASTILTDAGVDVTDDERSERFQLSLRSREVIAQAQGVIMERQGLSEDEAYTVLRVHSQRTGVSLRARAEEIAGSTRPPRADAAPRLGEDEDEEEDEDDRG